VADYAFGSSSFWTQERWYNLLSCDLYPSRDTYNTEVYPKFGLCLSLSLCTHPYGCDILFWGRRSCSCFLATEIVKFSPGSLVAHIHLSRCCGFACVRCQNSSYSLCFCCIWWALSLHSPCGLFFVDLACESVAPLTC
jgi:hypothetical protein